MRHFSGTLVTARVTMSVVLLIYTLGWPDRFVIKHLCCLPSKLPTGGAQMKCKIFAATLFVSLFLVHSAYAQNTYYLPHVANGNYGPGSFRMTFILFNNGDTDTSALLVLTDNNGQQLTMNIAGLGAASQFSIPLPAGTTRILQTDGLGSLVSGAAVVMSAAKIGVSAIFSIYDNSGNYVTESGVGSSEPLTYSVLPVDTTGLFNTGLALFNSSSADAAITLFLRDTNGQQVATAQMTLQRGYQTAKFIAGPDQLFPSFVNFQGTLWIQSTVPIAAMVLRQNLTPLSYTSLPVVSISSTGQTLNLAHVANGGYAGGSFKTSFLIFNISANPANVTLALTGNDGSPFNVTIPGRGTSSSFTFQNLAPRGSLFLQTDGLGALNSGAATITSNVPIGASGVFTVSNTQGAFLTETGVGDSPVLTSLTLPVDVTGNFDTGVAFFGTSGATLTFRLLDAGGTLVGPSATRNLAAKGHLAEFVTQLFPGTNNFRGSLAITATSGVAALTLRQYQSTSPFVLSYTTLPAASGTASGKAPAAVLLSKTETGITATGNVTLNEVLPSGFKLTGTVSGPGRGTFVIASSGSVSGYSGAVDQQTGKYLILLPAGTYDLNVHFTPNGVPSGQEVSVYSSVAGSVQVSADTTRDIILPAVSLFAVSGVVNGLNNLPALTSLPVLFNSTANPMVSAEFDVNPANGSYQGLLPAGIYTAGLIAPITFSTFQSQSLGLLNLGSVTVSGSMTIPPLTIPAMAKLSGTIRSSGEPLLGATVTATDSGNNIYSTSMADFLNAQYQAILPVSRTYLVNVATSLMQGTTLLGTISFPLTASSVNLAQDVANFDFTVPGLPAQVTISGQVTDSGGRPVGNVVISASSTSITGGQISQFNAFAQTDASGNYSMVVLSGTNYTIYFIPLPPTQ